MSKNALNPILFRPKRLRHLSWLRLKNLQIKTNLFYVWFTIHLDKQSSAIYLSEKLQNDHNPSWKLKNLSKFAQKKFILRVWYSDRTSEQNNLNLRLKLLLQADIDLDHFIYLGDVNLNYSSNEFNNFIILEIFDNFVFCEPINEKLPVKEQNVRKMSSNEPKKSYDLSLLRRLCNFDRVIQDNKKKADNFKSHTNPRLESLYHYTKLKLKVEEKNYNIELYKMNLDSIKQSITSLKETNMMLSKSILLYKNSRDNIATKCREQKENIIDYKAKCENILHEQLEFKKGIKIRQKKLVMDLREIFTINKMKNSSSKILNVCLDYSKKYEETTEIEMSVALGFFVQALEILSFIIAVPLRYPVVFRSSKSTIVEFVENGNIKEHALFRTTHDVDYSFIYALKLLENDVIQLRVLLDPKYDLKYKEDILTHLKWIFDYLVI